MRTLSFAVLGLFLVADGALAECVGFDVCWRFKHSGAVFVADVRDVATVQTATGLFQDVTFDVLEPLKNAPRGLATLRMRASVEGYSFRVSARVLVFTTRAADRSWENSCTGTRIVREEDRDLSIARALARGGNGGASITGRLVTVGSGQLIWTRELPGVRVTVRRTSGSTASVLTNR